MPKQTILSVKGFMTEMLEDNDSLVYVLIFFFRDKSVVMSNNDWNDMTFKECYIRPIKVLMKDDDGEFSSIDMKRLDEKFGPDWGIKFRINRDRRLSVLHDINCLEILGESKEFDGKQYYPSKIRMVKDNLTFMNKLAEKYKDNEGFKFRNKKPSEEPVDKHNVIPSDDESLV